MQNKKTLLIFPLITQLIFSLLVLIINKGLSLHELKLVFLAVSLPAFLVALPCVKFNYHQKQLFPIGFWAGLIGFFYMLIAMLCLSDEISAYMSLWDNTLMVLLSALTYGLTAAIYGMVVLRPFLRKRSTE